MRYRVLHEQSRIPVANTAWPTSSALLARKDALLGEFAHVRAEEDKLRALLAQAFALLPPGHRVTEDVADALGYSQPPVVTLVGPRRRSSDIR